MRKMKIDTIQLRFNIYNFRNKTSTAILTKRSPVMVAILPSPQESSEWLFKRRGNLK